MRPASQAAEEGQPVAPLARPEPDHGAEPDIAALRARGAQHLDPVRFRYIEALARRASGYDGVLRRLLERRLAQAVSAFETRHAAARSELDKAMPELLLAHPQAAQELRRLHASGDARAVRRLAGRLAVLPRGGTLADLIRWMDGQANPQEPVRDAVSDAAIATVTATDAMPLRELKAVRRFRDTWARLRLDEQLARSQEKVPENPGPLNSHLLVLRSLRRMQDLSPAYLAHFMAHAEALLWLDSASLAGSAVPGTAESRERVTGKGTGKGKGKPAADRPGQGRPAKAAKSSRSPRGAR